MAPSWFFPLANVFFSVGDHHRNRDDVRASGESRAYSSSILLFGLALCALVCNTGAERKGCRRGSEPKSQRVRIVLSGDADVSGSNGVVDLRSDLAGLTVDLNFADAGRARLHKFDGKVGVILAAFEFAFFDLCAGKFLQHKMLRFVLSDFAMLETLVFARGPGSVK